MKKEKETRWDPVVMDWNWRWQLDPIVLELI